MTTERSELDDEASESASAARATKKRAEAKHEEVDRIILEAREGEAMEPHPVIVERHPARETEMIVWRTPDGIAAADLLEMPIEGDLIAAREAQGCTLFDTRACTPEELDAIEREKQQALPLPGPEMADVVADLLADPLAQPAAAQGAEDVSAAAPGPAEGSPRDEETGCPGIVAEGPDGPLGDVLCTQPPAKRGHGFCEAHKALPGSDRARLVARRVTRLELRAAPPQGEQQPDAAAAG